MGDFRDGGKNVEQITERRGFFSTRNIGPGKDKGRAHTVLVKALFPHQAMLAQRESMIARENDEGVSSAIGFLEFIQDSADLEIHKTDAGVIVRHLSPQRLGPARPGQQLLVAYQHFAVVEWMLGQKVPWQRKPFWLVEFSERFRSHARVMRLRERHVEKKRIRGGVGA